MLIGIRQSQRAPDDLVDLLVECHGRIRRFVALARKAGERGDFPEREIVETCTSVERYFTEALPLHVADEEQSILPRLRGRSRDVDRVLSTMVEQHTDHRPMLGTLLDALARRRQRPADTTRGDELVMAATALEHHFHEHLDLEETALFFAICALDPSVQQEIVGEMRARRSPR